VYEEIKVPRGNPPVSLGHGGDYMTIPHSYQSTYLILNYKLISIDI